MTGCSQSSTFSMPLVASRYSRRARTGHRGWCPSGVIQAWITTGFILCDAVSFFAKKPGFVVRVTDESLGVNRVNSGPRMRAASWEIRWPVAMARRNKARTRAFCREGRTWNLSDCRTVRTFWSDQFGKVGALGGLCLKKEDRRRSHSRSSTLIPKPNVSGSRVAIMALVTVAGDTVLDEWKVHVANRDMTAGSMTLMLFSLMKVWNFFQPDSYCRRVEGLWP